MGIIIGFVAWRADSIYPSMTVHALYNFIGVIFVNMDEQNGLVQWYTWKDHVNPLLVIVALAVLIYALRAMNRIYRHP